MEKKISFGFSKVSKKSNLFVNKLEQKDDKNKIELIKCLEGQAIQLVQKKEEEAPLVIPLKDGGKTSAALLSLRTRQAVLNGEETPSEEQEVKKESAVEPNGNASDDIEKRAARELLAEISKENEEDGVGSTLVLPVKAEDLPLDGAKESTIDDYESIPITHFGKAMLRGMGWKEEPKKKGAPIEDGPVLRPKGMGLGADKALKLKPLLVPPEANEILEIKKGAFVRVLGGKHKDYYGQVEGLDDHAGRVILKMALGGIRESFNEFMVQPVSKKEYAQYSKCINSNKYDEYKRMENEYGQIVSKKEDNNQKSEDKLRSKIKNEDAVHKYHKHRHDDDDIHNVSSRRKSAEVENYPRIKTERRSRSRERPDDHAGSSTSHKKYSSRRTPSRHQNQSDDSQSSSDSTTYRSKHKKKSSKSKKSKKSKDKKHERRQVSDASSDDERRHKKKTKKSKRGRSRSRSKGRR